MKHLLSTKTKARITSTALSMALLLMTLCMGLSAKAVPVGTQFPSDGSDAGDGDVYFIGYTVSSEAGDFVVPGDDVSGEKMFDGKPTTKGCIGFTGFYSVEFSYSKYIIPHSYYLRTAGDTNVFDARNPSAWKLEGKNSDNTWTVLDNKSEQAITTDNITSEKFYISNTEAYKTFRLTVTANNAGGYDPWPAGGKPTFQLAEVYMSGVKGPDPIPYMDWNGTELVEKTGDDACIKYGVINSGSTALNAGWYVLNSDVVITDNIVIFGDIKLILCDGKTLTVNNDGNMDGFSFRNGGALTIYGQSGGTGKLDVTSTYEVGICANGLTVNGGTVTAKSDKTDGIRSENGLTVNGGAVTATGLFNGIHVNGNATVNGGTVNASGTENGISVGGAGGTCLYVNGGEVTAAGGEKAISGFVESVLPGIGWADTAGTAGREGILKSKATRDFDYKKIRLAPHDHEFNFAAAGATVTATCLKGDCPEGYDGAGAPTLTLNAPALTVYGGTDNRRATLTSNLPKNYAAFKNLTGTDFSEDDIKYVGRDGTDYAESAFAPDAAGKYTAKITVGGATASVDYEIAKADPGYTVPTGLNAVCGDTLSSVALPDGWTWADGTQSVGNVGTKTFKANFTPADTANYNTISGEDVTVKVDKAAGKKAVISTDTMSYSPDSIEIEGVAGQEYIIVIKGTAISGESFSSPVLPDSARDNRVLFENLNAALEYEIYTRTAETATSYASDTVKANVHTTLSCIGLDFDSMLAGATVTAAAEPETAGLTYKWYQDEVTVDGEGAEHHALTEIEGATGASYTFRAEDDGKYVTVKIFAGDSEVGDATTPEPIAVSATVIFDSKGGSKVENATGIAYKGKLTKPADPTRKGYAFDGWYREEEYETPWDFENETALWTEYTLYAKWTPNDYNVTSVAGLADGNGKWTKGLSEGVVITIKLSEADDTCFDHFVGVKLDGRSLVKDADYTVRKGSTIITLLPATLEKLSAGEHTVTVLFDNGEANTTLTVDEAKEESTTSPETGDGSNNGLWIMLIILSLSCLAATLFIGKKKRVFDR